jgi:hypothetical protein
MSLEDGWAAVNLEMPKRIPRMELSITEYHWELMKAVTGLDVDQNSPETDKLRAAQAFIQAWNYDIFFACMVGDEVVSAKRTNMGHAVYAADGSDFDNDIYTPFTNLEEVLAFDPWDAFGFIDRSEYTCRFEEHYRSQCEKFPTNVNMTGIYPSLITGLTYIFGWELLLEAAGTSPDRFGEVVGRYARWMQQFYDALADADVPLVYSHDDLVWTAGPIFHPDWYRTYVFPNIKKYWDPLRESGKKIIFVCDGDYSEFIDDVAECGNHGFWCEIFTDLSVLADRYGESHFLIGNGDTRILLRGDRAAIRNEVQRCMDIGKSLPGYFMSISNHIPPNTPVENALYYNQVYEEICRR